MSTAISPAISPLAPTSVPEMPAIAGVRLATAAAGIRYKDRTPALVKRIAFHRKNEWMTGNLEIELELPIPARPGSPV